MHKSIWYISKYCTVQNAKSIGSRGWLLSKEFSKFGYKSTVITSDTVDLIDPNNIKEKTYFNIENVQVIILKILKYSNPKSIKRILSWFDFELQLFFLNKKNLCKPDIIIVSSLSILTIINGIYLKYKFRCQLIFEIRDIWPLTLIEIGHYSNYNPAIIFLKIVEYFGYKKSDIIIGTMPNIKEHVKNVLRHDKPVYCIPMGLSRNMIQKNTQSIPLYVKKHLSGEFFNVVYAGTIGTTNSLESFFSAAVILKNYSKIRFVLVGDGPLRKIYIKKFGPLPNVLYFTKINKNQIQSFLSYSHLVYYATFKSNIYDYGQSANKLIDYMISKKPILASYSGYQSMINEANCGFFTPAEDPHLLAAKILKISRMKKSKLNTLGMNGYKWVLKNRNYKRLAREYLNLIIN